MRTRQVLIVTDVLRAIALASIPAVLLSPVRKVRDVPVGVDS